MITWSNAVGPMVLFALNVGTIVIGLVAKATFLNAENAITTLLPLLAQSCIGLAYRFKNGSGQPILFPQ